jgi:hypothetical protein
MAKAKPKAPPREHHARPGVRRAFECLHAIKDVRDCRTRVFIAEGETPECREHGSTYMAHQSNRAYLGQSTE